MNDLRSTDYLFSFVGGCSREVVLSLSDSSPLMVLGFSDGSTNMEFFFSSPTASWVVLPSFVVVDLLPVTVTSFVLYIVVEIIGLYSTAVSIMDFGALYTIFKSDTTIYSSDGDAFNFLDITVDEIVTYL